VLIFYLEFIYTSYTTYSLYLFSGVWPSQQATLEDSSIIPYAELGDCSDHQTHLRSQPRSEICRLVSMLCSKTVPTTEHVYVLNHAWRLVDQPLHCAWDLCRPPGIFTFSTTLEDLSTSLYAIVRACFDHSPTTAWGLLFSVTYKLDSYTTEGQF